MPTGYVPCRHAPPQQQLWPEGVAPLPPLCPVQASAGELRAALRDMGAVELSGRWCLVDAAYMGGLLELLILT